MLIENPVKQGDIISLKLMTGEELVCKLKSKENNVWTVYNPLVLVISPDQSGNQSVNVIPYMFGQNKDNSVKISDDKVLAHCLTQENIKNQYIEMTTGIKIANSNFGQ